MIGLSQGPIDPVALLAKFQASAVGAGAIVSFIGIVRETNLGGSVEGLWLDYHERLSAAALETIGAEACRRFRLIEAGIIHRVGDVGPGEPVVFVAAAALHRRAAFDAVDYTMDRIKTEAPFWKRETRDGAHHWIETRPSDHADRSRWEDEVGG